jgi:hypothetical protein
MHPLIQEKQHRVKSHFASHFSLQTESYCTKQVLGYKDEYEVKHWPENGKSYRPSRAILEKRFFLSEETNESSGLLAAEQATNTLVKLSPRQQQFQLLMQNSCWISRPV